MDIKILHSHLTKYLKTNAKPKDIARCMALCGPSCERVYRYGDKDWLYEIEITTNRVDSMSVIGIARELSAILPEFGYQADLTELTTTFNKEDLLAQYKKQHKINPDRPKLSLTINHNSKLSKRVMAVVMDNIKVKSSPKWLKDTIEANNIRSLNNVIDITNYVMTEIGHPTHVFDYDRLMTENNSTPIMNFRLSQKGEEVITLDNKKYNLPGEDIVITNANDEIIDLPGIMGTANSVVTNDTKRIVFFIDNNDAKRMRKTSMTLGIRTVAVTLNEKHVDPELGELALQRGIQLFKQLAGGQIASKFYDYYIDKPKPTQISITHKFIETKIGVPLKVKFITKTLKSLGFKLNIIKDQTYQITPPSWRINDVTIPEDIIEEIARIYGYYKLPNALPLQQQPPKFDTKDQFYWENITRHALKHWGFYETHSYSLISKEQLEDFGYKPNLHLKLKNPLSSEWVYMRQSLIPSLTRIIQLNQNKSDTLQLFELNNIYIPQQNKLPKEIMTLALAQNGDNFLHLKGIIEALSEELNITLKFSPSTENRYLNKQSQTTINVNNKIIGYIGILKSSITQKHAIKDKITVAWLNFEQLSTYATKNKTYIPIPKYPPVIEHLTFYNNKHILASKIIQTALDSNQLINVVNIIDHYQQKLSLKITYLDKNQNLSDDKIKPIRQKLVQDIEKLGLKLQGQV